LGFLALRVGCRLAFFRPLDFAARGAVAGCDLDLEVDLGSARRVIFGMV
jgi:hypothetical protein